MLCNFCQAFILLVEPCAHRGRPFTHSRRAAEEETYDGHPEVR
jgi:hypothetical protein